MERTPRVPLPGPGPGPGGAAVLHKGSKASPDIDVMIKEPRTRGPVRFYSRDFDYKEHAELWKRAAAERPSPLNEGPHSRNRDDAHLDATVICAADSWNLFFVGNDGETYQDRRYIFTEFETHFTFTQEPLSILEVGAGCGATALPLLDELEAHGIGVRLYTASDLSNVAVSRLVLRIQKASSVGILETKVLDVASVFADAESSEMLVGARDMVLSIFCLSAVHPRQHLAAMQNVFRLLRPGGKLLFRDYAQYDSSELKHTPVFGEKSLYIRKDATLAFYFTTDYLQMLATRSGFQVVEMQTHCISSVNRKTETTLRRCFLHCVLIRPLVSELPLDYFETERRKMLGSCNTLLLTSPFSNTNALLQMKDFATLYEWGGSHGSMDPQLFPSSKCDDDATLMLKGKQARAAILASLARIDKSALMRFELSFGAAGKDGLNSILEEGEAIPLKSLRCLNLESNKAGACIDSFLSALAGDRILSLVSLNLSFNPITGQQAQRLGDWLSGQTVLRDLNVRGCSLCSLGGEDSFLLLASRACRAGVEFLDLSEERRISETGLLRLLQDVLSAPSSLLQIVLDVMTWTEVSAFAFGSTVANSSSIARVSWAESRVTNALLCAFCRGLANFASSSSKTLRLNLARNADIDDAGPLLDFIYVGSATLVRLDWLSLRGCRLKLEAQAKLAGRIACSSSLAYVDLQNSGLLPIFVTTLCARLAIQWKKGKEEQGGRSLTCLNLSYNELGDQCVARLFSLLRDFSASQPLRVLVLARCYIGESGSARLAEFLSANKEALGQAKRRTGGTGPRAGLLLLAMSKTECSLPTVPSNYLHFVPLPLCFKVSFLCSVRRRRLPITSDTLRYILSFLWQRVPFRFTLL